VYCSVYTFFCEKQDIASGSVNAGGKREEGYQRGKVSRGRQEGGWGENRGGR